MNTTLSLIALALAGTLAVQAQEAPPEGGPRERRGNRQVPPELLKEFDKDGDGKLNAEEAKAAREAAQKKMLEKYDTDKDGKLGDDERKAMRQDIQAKRKALLEKYDTNKNSRLDPEEMKAAREAGEEIPAMMGPGGRRGEGRPQRGERPAPPAGE